MSRKSFVLPRILMGGDPIDPGTGPDPGHGSAQSSTDFWPCDWETWCAMYSDYDPDGNGTPGTWEDYVFIMTQSGYADLIDQSGNPGNNPEP